MVERLKNPIIVSLETHLAGISAQTQKEFDNLEAFRRRFELVLERETTGARNSARAPCCFRDFVCSPIRIPRSV